MIESDRDIYFEDDTATSQGPREIMFKVYPIVIPVPIAHALISSSIVDKHLVATTDDEPIEDKDPVVSDVVMDLRRSKRVRRDAISNDYIVYFHEHEYDMGDVSNSTTYKEAIVSPQSKF